MDDDLVEIHVVQFVVEMESGDELIVSVMNETLASFTADKLAACVANSRTSWEQMLSVEGKPRQVFKRTRGYDKPIPSAYVPLRVARERGWR